MALIAVGCLGISLAPRWSSLPDYAVIKLPAGLLISTSLLWIDAGIGLPFHRWREGAAVGFLFHGFFIYALWYFSMAEPQMPPRPPSVVDQFVPVPGDADVEAEANTAETETQAD